jgi:hypothetical protein
MAKIAIPLRSRVAQPPNLAAAELELQMEDCFIICGLLRLP